MKTITIKGVFDNWADKPNEFFERLDNAGGWPVNYKFASFFHSISGTKRPVKFGNENLRTPWWTTRYCAKDYHKWKVKVAG